MAGETRALLQGHARTIRLVAWLALIPIVGLYSLARESGTPAGDVLRVVTFLVPVVAAFGGCLLAFAVSARQTRERLFWGVSAVATAFLLASETYYSWYQLAVDMSGPPVPSPFDLLNFLAAVTFATLLVIMLRRRMRGFLGTAGGAAGTVALAAFLYAVTYRWVAEPLVHALGRSPALGAVWAAYILVGAVLFVGALGSLFGHAEVRASGWQVVICIALAAYGLNVLLWPVWYLEQGGQGTTLADVSLSIGYLCGYYLFFMGSLYWVTGPEPERAVMLAPRVRPVAADMVLTTASLLALPLMAWWVYSAPPRSVDRVVYFVATAIVTGTAVLRTALADVESVSLGRLESRDILTGLLNRRGFDTLLEELIEEASALRSPLSVVALDVDDFARFNVMRGRAVGDDVLRSFGQAFTELLPHGAAAARLSGDEFAVALPGVEKADAVVVARVMADAATALVPHGDILGISGGVATAPADGESGAQLLEHADGALYWAKYQGKRQVVGFDEVVGHALQAESRIRAIGERSRLDIVRALAAATDARDAATSYHSRQVAALAAIVCEALGLDEERIKEIQTAGLLHDVGKVAVPDSVLRKRARLSPGERAVLREHAELGARILEATDLARMAPWVRAHHERWDGSGYPDGLAGEEIPLEARIIGACNVFDQIVSGSPERPPLSRQAALYEIDQGLGRALDPQVGEALIRVVGASRALGWSEAWLS